MNPDLAGRVRELEERLARVEGLLGGVARVAGSSGAGVGRGVVSYRGEVDLAGPVDWEIAYDAGAVLALDRDRIAAVLSALGHPVRLAIVAHLLRGEASSAELQAEVGEGSTGQLYHHLGALTAAGVIAKRGRNQYGVRAPAVVPVLVALLAGADLGGVLAGVRAQEPDEA